MARFEAASAAFYVAIVEPGVIATAIYGKAPADPPASRYPHCRRMAALFAASLKNPVSPFVVGDVIRGIVKNGSWQLRYATGPHAQPFMNGRASMTDEQWVDWASVSDTEWAANIKRDFGLDVAIP